MVTIYEIAKELNISPATVSRALNNKPNVSKSTKKAVISIAEKLHYVPNSLASSLRNGRGKTIGIIVPQINHQFFSSIIHGAEKTLISKDYNLLICQSNESFVKEVQSINSLLSSRVDGILISHSKETTTPEHLTNIIKAGIPLVQFDRVFPNIGTSYVTNDNYNSSYHSVVHLLEQGYTRIAHLHGPITSKVHQDRKKGYEQAILNAGIEIFQDHILEGTTEETGYNAAKKLMNLKNPPDAFFCASDYSALGVLNYALENNLKVPKDIGIVGFANEPFTRLTRPKITTLDQFSENIGIEAATILLNELEDKESTIRRTYSLVPSLTLRESSMRLDANK